MTTIGIIILIEEILFGPSKIMIIMINQNGSRGRTGYGGFVYLRFAIWGVAQKWSFIPMKIDHYD
jgi:hypothetical protein